MNDMEIKKVNYDDKTDLSTNPEVARINKIVADDLNQIKEAVNTNADSMSELDYEIIENSNGTAIKYNDGRLECYATINTADVASGQWGPFYYKEKTVTFPETFIEKPTIVANAYGNSGMYFCGLGSDTSMTTTGCTIRLMSIQSIQATDFWYTYHAIGRWKE